MEQRQLRCGRGQLRKQATRVARAVRDRDRAQDEMDKHASGREKLKRELREALTPDTHKPSAKSKETLPPKSKKEREDPER